MIAPALSRIARTLTTVAALLCACLASLSAWSTEVEPDALVRSVSQDVMGILEQHAADPGSAAVQEMVSEKVLPHFDFARMAALASGLAWRSATPEQKAELTEEFRSLLVRTYSKALGKFRGQKLEFDPQRKSADQRKAIVRSRLVQAGSEPITVDYRMAVTATGWKVYDVSVDGVSLVTTYRDAFAEESRRNGIPGLIRMLKDKNANLAAGRTA
ncbi:MAG: putative phospholipid-binding protein MlaC [Pseudomonadales bacterium]|nr:putative phospholipid-binding protein MlaC [Pseudomonadales bacterium]